MKNNFTALFAVILALTPLFAGTILFGDRAWWWRSTPS